MSLPPRIYDAHAVALAQLTQPRTTLYPRRDEVAREELYLDKPGTPHHDHRQVSPEFGARVIAGITSIPGNGT